MTQEPTREERTLAVAEKIAQILEQHGVSSAIIGAWRSRRTATPALVAILAELGPR